MEQLRGLHRQRPVRTIAPFVVVIAVTLGAIVGYLELVAVLVDLIPELLGDGAK